MRNVLKWEAESKKVAIDYISDGYVTVNYQENYGYGEENTIYTLAFMTIDGKIYVQDGSVDLGNFKTQKAAIEFIEKYLGFNDKLIEWTQEEKDLKMENLIFMKEIAAKKEAEKAAAEVEETEKVRVEEFTCTKAAPVVKETVETVEETEETTEESQELPEEPQEVIGTVKTFEQIGEQAKLIDVKEMNGATYQKWAILDDPMDRRIFTRNGKIVATLRDWGQFKEWLNVLHQQAFGWC